MEAKGICMAVASLGLLSFAFGFISIYVASLITGVGLGVYGLSLIMHSLRICPACNL
ncbi:MAG: hypothetical protein NTY68_05220 [Candidatus Micrarchaeota archaeon]|nr:hypothetical protein [Candidatus Micrarchaeota archaeon]